MQDNGPVQFSVVIPLYNKEDFIQRTVGSVLAQTHPHFELIVVDDGSTDGSIQRLQSIADSRLRIVRQRNAGEGPARNSGMRESASPWIALLDADDYWFPDHLAELAVTIREFPSAGLIATSYLQGEEPAAAQPVQAETVRRELSYFEAASVDVGVAWSSAVALRKDIASEVGEFGTARTGADLEYWARMALAAPVAKSNRITAYYFRNDQSIMAQEFRERSNAPVPRSLLDHWPSVALLERIKDDPAHARLRPAMIKYQRNAVLTTVNGLLVQGRIRAARSVARLIPGRRPDRAAATALALRLPAPLIELALRLRRKVRGGP